MRSTTSSIIKRHGLIGFMAACFAASACAAPSMDPALWSEAVPRVQSRSARERFVSPQGKSSAAGSERSPWDLTSVLAGQQNVTPGSVIWVRGGHYRYPVRNSSETGFTVKLSGQPDKPVFVRAYPGEHVVIDGGLSIQARHVWIWGLDISVTDDWRPETQARDSSAVFPVPSGIVNVTRGAGVRLVNCLMHNNRMGIGYWKHVAGGEIYGCVIYDNGFPAADRPHGPAIYTQNESGVERRIVDNIIAGNFSLPLQMYGSRIDRLVNNYTVEGNILYAPRTEARGRTYALIGGNRSKNMVFRNNVVWGYSVRLGSGANQVGEDNLIVRGGYGGPTPEKNRLVRNPAGASESFTLLRVNRYDPSRAHAVTANWDGDRTVRLDPDEFLKRGEKFRVMSPFDQYGEALAEGVYNGRSFSVRVPQIPWDVMGGTPNRPAVFVLMKDVPGR